VLAKRCGQSTAVGEIIIGICLGPSLFGLLAPRAFDYVFHSAPPEPLTILSNVGLIMIEFNLGGLLAVIFTAAMTAYQIGIFAIFGGFMMGVILYDEPGLVAAWRGRMGDFVAVFFLPIFFTYTGLRTSIGGLDTWADWGLCLAIVASASIAKLGGGYLAARRSGFDHPQSAIIGFMMNTRALMELIVINVGLDLGVISPKVFTMLVIMAIFSTVITTPALRHYLKRTGLAGTSSVGVDGAVREAGARTRG
jgi:Kef-type K+ transport system membrane component KefB